MSGPAGGSRALQDSGSTMWKWHFILLQSSVFFIPPLSPLHMAVGYRKADSRLHVAPSLFIPPFLSFHPSGQRLSVFRAILSDQVFSIPRPWPWPWCSLHLSRSFSEPLNGKKKNNRNLIWECFFGPTSSFLSCSKTPEALASPSCTCRELGLLTSSDGS